ncbi:MAG: hypothetical protein IPH76_10500 [Xanthomonadales bacterium]|nr:hypothetical protein [Xanthomonadales bacterium]
MLREHEARIDKCRGTACFEDLCRGLNETSANELARQIDDDHGRLGPDGLRQFSGKYRQWRYGKAPSDETIALVESRFAGKTRLRRWRDLWLWDLLREPFKLTLPELHEEMTHLPPRIRKLLFLSAGPNAMGRFPRHAMSRERVLELRDLKSLDAFMALLALAREGELINQDQRHVFPALCAFGIFAHVLAANPQLEASWEPLYDALHLAIWSRIYLEGIHPNFDKQWIVAHRAALRLDPNARCAVSGGLRRDQVKTTSV